MVRIDLGVHWGPIRVRILRRHCCGYWSFGFLGVINCLLKTVQRKNQNKKMNKIEEMQIETRERELGNLRPAQETREFSALQYYYI